MKNLKYLFLALVLSLALAPSSFALQCKAGNYGSDECWTNVQVSSLETTPVVSGVVLEYEVSGGGSPDNNAFVARVANASADWAHIAGVAQSTISTGDVGLVMVRGQGRLKKAAGVLATGDAVYVGASGNAGAVASAGAKSIGFSLQASTEPAATIDAYITIV